MGFSKPEDALGCLHRTWRLVIIVWLIEIELLFGVKTIRQNPLKIETIDICHAVVYHSTSQLFTDQSDGSHTTSSRTGCIELIKVGGPINIRT